MLVRPTAVVKPPIRVIFTVAAPDPPCGMLSVVGATASVKPGAAVIVRLTVCVCAVTPSPWPRTVIVVVAAAAVPAAVSVIVPVVALAAIVSGDAVTPFGSPSTETATEPVKPPVLVIETLSVPVPAAAMFALTVGASASDVGDIAVGAPPA